MRKRSDPSNWEQRRGGAEAEPGARGGLFTYLLVLQQLSSAVKTHLTEEALELGRPPQQASQHRHHQPALHPLQSGLLQQHPASLAAELQCCRSPPTAAARSLYRAITIA